MDGDISEAAVVCEPPLGAPRGELEAARVAADALSKRLAQRIAALDAGELPEDQLWQPTAYQRVLDFAYAHRGADVRYYALWEVMSGLDMRGVHVSVGTTAYAAIIDVAGGFAHLAWHRFDNAAEAVRANARRAPGYAAPMPAQLFEW